MASTLSCLQVCIHVIVFGLHFITLSAMLLKHNCYKFLQIIMMNLEVTPQTLEINLQTLEVTPKTLRVTPKLELTPKTWAYPQRLLSLPQGLLTLELTPKTFTFPKHSWNCPQRHLRLPPESIHRVLLSVKIIIDYLEGSNPILTHRSRP